MPEDRIAFDASAVGSPNSPYLEVARVQPGRSTQGVTDAASRVRLEELPEIVAAARPADIPPLALYDAATVGIDFAACSAFALGGRRYVDLTTHPTYDILGAGHAAYIRALSAHAEDYDSTHYPSFGHPASIVIAAASVCMDLGLLDEKSMLHSYCMAVDIMTAIGEVCGAEMRDRGWHVTPLAGAPAAAGAIAWAMGMDEVAIRRAMASASTVAASIHGSGTGLKAHAVGMSAAAVLNSVMQSTLGIGRRVGKYAPWSLLMDLASGRKVGSELTLVALPGGVLEAVPTRIKRFPVCAYFDPILDMLTAADRKLLRRADQVHIAANRETMANSLYEWPESLDEARFSLMFSVGLLLSCEHEGPRQISEIDLTDANIGRAVGNGRVVITAGETNEVKVCADGVTSVLRHNVGQTRKQARDLAVMKAKMAEEQVPTGTWPWRLSDFLEGLVRSESQESGLQ